MTVALGNLCQQSWRRAFAVAAAGLAIAAATGCVRRTITITSDPDGALVYLNHREIGRTPVEVEFLYYGDYDVRLVKDGFEPLIVKGDASPPLWDAPPVDLFAEAVPDTRSRIFWHYQLEPVVADPAALLDRARVVREQLATDIAESGVEIAVEPEEPADDENGDGSPDSGQDKPAESTGDQS